MTVPGHIQVISQLKGENTRIIHTLEITNSSDDVNVPERKPTKRVRIGNLLQVIYGFPDKHPAEYRKAMRKFASPHRHGETYAHLNRSTFPHAYRI